MAEAVVSFRDPAGFVILTDDKVYRYIKPEAKGTLLRFLQSADAAAWVASGKIPKSEELADPAVLASLRTLCGAKCDSEGLWLEHETVPFASYPFEWCPEMLYAAGELTLELAAQVMKLGMGLKDATPYNVLFVGTRPVFVDLLSFETRDAGDPTWLAYGQFVRTILLPLVVSRHFHWSIQSALATRRDGITPEEVYRSSSLWQRLRPPFLELVSLPVWLARRQSVVAPHTQHDAEKAAYILKKVLGRAAKALRSLKPQVASSDWSRYMGQLDHYDEPAFRCKTDFVRKVLAESAPRNVLDVGCNTGHFTLMAADAGAWIVAIDRDEAAVSHVFRAAQSQSAAVLPLVVDLANSTPAYGWKNRETRSFLERATGKFDLVMMLAVIHHMLVNDRIPLDDILGLCASLSRGLVLIEFVPTSDPMFKRMAQRREHLHQDLTQSSFEAACEKLFTIAERVPVGSSGRVLYLLRKRSPCAN